MKEVKLNLKQTKNYNNEKNYKNTIKSAVCAWVSNSFICLYIERSLGGNETYFKIKLLNGIVPVMSLLHLIVIYTKPLASLIQWHIFFQS